MAPLLCPSPILIDQSFPRTEMELRKAAVALGELAALVERGEVELLLTDALVNFLELFDCGTGDRPYSLIHDIYALLDTWVLNAPIGVIRLDVSSRLVDEPHPIPASCSSDGLVDIWASEAGKLFAIHSELVAGDECFIGVACESAFSGGPLGHYHPPPRSGFPMVGPAEIPALADANEWTVLPDVHRKEVSFAQAKRNIRLLGATHVKPPESGSHYIVKFPGCRPWPLDRNTDPLPERFLRQLVRITSYPIEVVKSVLISGEPPHKRSKLADYTR